MPYHLHLPVGDTETVVKPLVPGKKLTVGRKDCDANIPNDASISRTHCTFLVGLDQNGVTVHDCSKFGVLVDGVRLDASDTNGAVFLRRRGEKKSCEVKFGCVKPVVYTARLVFTEEEEEEGAAEQEDDATTDGDVTDAEAEAGDDMREDENENEAPNAAPTPNPAQADALHAVSRPAQTNFGTADVTEGKATTVFERLPPPRVRNGPPGGSNRDDPEPLEPTAVNFKKFKKQKLGLPGIEPATTTGRGARGARAAPPRRNIIRYADEAYDALPQWEDASAAATHAAERADVRTAEEMFLAEQTVGETGGGAAKKPAPRRRGAAARGK